MRSWFSPAFSKGLRSQNLKLSTPVWVLYALYTLATALWVIGTEDTLLVAYIHSPEELRLAMV